MLHCFTRVHPGERMCSFYEKNMDLVFVCYCKMSLFRYRAMLCQNALYRMSYMIHTMYHQLQVSVSIIRVRLRLKRWISRCWPWLIRQDGSRLHCVHSNISNSMVTCRNYAMRWVYDQLVELNHLSTYTGHWRNKAAGWTIPANTMVLTDLQVWHGAWATKKGTSTISTRVLTPNYKGWSSPRNDSPVSIRALKGE